VGAAGAEVQAANNAPPVAVSMAMSARRRGIRAVSIDDDICSLSSASSG
jgi:hypothetical protein